MKAISLFVLLTLSLSAIAQPTIFWEDEIVVADGVTFGNVRPRISLGADGNPLVLFGKGSQGYLFFAKGNGTNFNLPISILPNGLNTYLSYWTGPDLAANGDTVIAVFKALPFDGGKVYVVRSIDGGLSFSDTIRADSHNSGMVWMPAIEMNEEGKIALTYMAHDGAAGNPRYIYSMSTDAGLTFSPEIEIDTAITGEACDCCPAELVMKGDQEALLYRNNDANMRDIFAVYSSDGGTTFLDSDNIDQLNWNIDYCPSTGPDAVFIPDGLLSVFESKASGYSRVYVSKSNTLGDFSFTERIQLNSPTNPVGKQIYPRIANDGNLIVVTWAESEMSNSEIYCALSIDGTLNQFNTTKQQVNLTTAGIQTNPDVLVNGNEIHLVYQDNGAGNVKYRKGTLSGLALDELEDEQIIYPNPTNGQVCIEIENQTIERILVYDLQGQLIKVSTESQFDLSDYSNGTYFVRGQTEKGFYCYKLIKQ